MVDVPILILMSDADIRIRGYAEAYVGITNKYRHRFGYAIVNCNLQHAR